MSEVNKVFEPENWEIATTEYIIDNLKNQKNEFSIFMWKNIENKISPLDLYKYLKARFGLPNGMMMFTKERGTTENLIHWHYHILSLSNEIHFIGKSSGIEVCLKIKKDILFNKKDWQILINNVKKSYSKFGKEMGQVQKEFEHYTLFINPFARLDKTLLNLTSKLKLIKIDEPKNTLEPDTPKIDRENFFSEYKEWVNNIEEAASLGSTIRMLCPVLGESFINLLILLLAKDEIKKDKRLYDDLLKRQIDVRIKSLHIYCNGFTKAIDSKNQIFKDYHTIMNNRNDFLHGNIDPKLLMFEDVYFDEGDTPLFKEDGGIISKTMNNFLKNVEPKIVLEDYEKTLKFITFILQHLEEGTKKSVIILMSTRLPAINRQTDNLAILFPNLLAEGYI